MYRELKSEIEFLHKIIDSLELIGEIFSFHLKHSPFSLLLTINSTMFFWDEIKVTPKSTHLVQRLEKKEWIDVTSLLLNLPRIVVSGWSISLLKGDDRKNALSNTTEVKVLSAQNGINDLTYVTMCYAVSMQTCLVCTKGLYMKRKL